jgi:hypothetical protein
MPMTIACTKCAKQLHLPESLLGQLVSCPSCHTTFTVADNNGRVSVRSLGDPEPSAPLPVPRARPVEPRPFLPVSAHTSAPRPFVFRVLVLHDPERTLVGPAQARVSTAGLELRDRDGRIFDVSIGDPAEHLAGNRLRVRVNGRDITVQIVQRACQQAKLAQDLALFLNGKREVLRLADYRPRRAMWSLVLVPVVGALVMACAGLGGWVGAVTWIGMGLVFCVVTGLVVRNEAMTLQRRLVWTCVVWGIGLLLLVPAVPIVLALHRNFDTPRLTWQTVLSDDGKWQALMPAWPTRMNRPLFGNFAAPNFDGQATELPRNRGTFEIWHRDLTPDEKAQPLDVHFLQVRAHYMSTGTVGWQVISTNSIILHGNADHPGREMVVDHGDGKMSKLRVYLVGPRLYVLRATWQRNVRAADIDLFFNSFALVEVQPDGPRGGPQWTPRVPDRPAQLAAPGALKGLLVHWPFNEGQGLHVGDASGNGQHGTLLGGTWIDGVEGKAMVLDGRGEWFDFSKAPGLNFRGGRPFTITFWMAAPAGTWGPILSMQNTETWRGEIRLELANNGWLTARVSDDNAVPGAHVTVSSKLAPVESWNHVALIRHDDGSLEMYVNGQSSGRRGINAINAFGSITTTSRGLGCCWLNNGRPEPAQFACCAIDEFCIFDRALPAGEIMALWGH